MTSKRFLRTIILVAGILFAYGTVYALSSDSQELYGGLSIPPMPLLCGETVLVQDKPGGTYTLMIVDLAGTASEVRDNGTTYLWPLGFNGTHAAWISYAGKGMRKTCAGPTDGPGNTGYPMPEAQYKIRMISVVSHNEQDITSGAAYKDFVAMDADDIVWTDYRHTTATDTFNEVYHASISNPSPTRVTNAVSYKAAIDIAGNRIVWQDYRNAKSTTTNADIFLYDLGGGKEREICTNGAYQDQPSIHGDIVVWQDFRNAGGGDNSDIFLFDLKTNRDTCICSAVGYQAYPKVYGDYVVWQDYRENTSEENKRSDIYCYQISTATTIALTNSMSYKGPPSLYGDKVVWYDYGNSKLYCGTIIDNSTSLSFRIKAVDRRVSRTDGGESMRFTVLGARDSHIQSNVRRGTGVTITVSPGATTKRKIVVFP